MTDEEFQVVMRRLDAVEQRLGVIQRRHDVQVAYFNSDEARREREDSERSLAVAKATLAKVRSGLDELNGTSASMRRRHPDSEN